MDDLQLAIQLLKTDKSLRSKIYVENQKIARKKQREEFKKNNPEVALEQERKKLQKQKIKEARESKNPQTEEKKKEREQELLENKNKIETERKKRIEKYVIEYCYGTELIEHIKNIELFKREDYVLAMILMNDKKEFKEEFESSELAEEWLEEKLKMLEEEYV